MNQRFLRGCVFWLLVSTSLCIEAADVRRYALADRGAIVLTVPDDWREEVRSGGPNLPPTIVYKARTGATFEFLVTPIWPLKADLPRPAPGELRASVIRAADSVRSQAIEAEIKLEEFKGSQAFGVYFSVTDRAPKPGEYRYMTQGMMGLADLRVTFTVLTNEGREAIVAKALELLGSARREGAGGTAR